VKGVAHIAEDGPLQPVQRIEVRCDFSFWPTSEDLRDAQSHQLIRGTGDAPVERAARPFLTLSPSRAYFL
jgi:hypothetical protein